MKQETVVVTNEGSALLVKYSGLNCYCCVALVCGAQVRSSGRNLKCCQVVQWLKLLLLCGVSLRSTGEKQR